MGGGWNLSLLKSGILYFFLSFELLVYLFIISLLMKVLWGIKREPFLVCDIKELISKTENSWKKYKLFWSLLSLPSALYQCDSLVWHGQWQSHQN